MIRRRSIAGTGRAPLTERKDDVYPFSNGLPATSAMSFAWFVSDAGRHGRAEVRRISWEPAP
jgi:hypothetical protein